MLDTKSPDALKHTNLGKEFNTQELEMLLAYTELRVFSDGELILQQGKKSNGIYIIIDGVALITAKILGESIASIETVGPGSFLGEISFIENGPCTTSAIASRHVECLFINTIYFEMISSYFPVTKYKLLMSIAREVCRRIKLTHDKIMKVIAHTDMIPRSMFSELIKSLATPERTHFEDWGLSAEQIKKSPLLHEFSEPEVDELLKHSTLLNVVKNCTLVAVGEKNTSCYIILRGAAQSNIMHDNKVCKLSIIGPQTLFATATCVDLNFSPTIVFHSCEQAVLLKIAQAELDFIRDHHPEQWHKLFNLICQSLVLLKRSIDKLDIRLQIEIYNR